MSSVAGHVAAYLGQPVGLGGGFGELLFERIELALAELVAVPEVAVHEDSEARGRDDDVWLAWLVGGVDAITQPARPQRPAQRQLWRVSRSCTLRMMAEISSADRFAGVLDGIVLDVILEGALLTSLLMVCAQPHALHGTT